MPKDPSCAEKADGQRWRLFKNADAQSVARRRCTAQCAFLRHCHKGRVRLFFSEEKNQKTFAAALAQRYGIWPERGEGHRDNAGRGERAWQEHG
jgi:hypothetical protein